MTPQEAYAHQGDPGHLASLIKKTYLTIIIDIFIISHNISYIYIIYIYIYPYYGQVKASFSEIAKSLMFVVGCSCEAFAACRSYAGHLQCSTWRCGSARSAAGGCGEEMSGVVRWGWIGWVLNPWCDTCYIHVFSDFFQVSDWNAQHQSGQV